MALVLVTLPLLLGVLLNVLAVLAAGNGKERYAAVRVQYINGTDSVSVSLTAGIYTAWGSQVLLGIRISLLRHVLILVLIFAKIS